MGIQGNGRGTVCATMESATAGAGSRAKTNSERVGLAGDLYYRRWTVPTVFSTQRKTMLDSVSGRLAVVMWGRGGKGAP